MFLSGREYMLEGGERKSCDFVNILNCLNWCGVDMCDVEEDIVIYILYNLQHQI